MHSLLGYARSTFWLTGILQILMGLYLAVRSLAHLTDRPLGAVIVCLFGMLCVGLGALSCFSARSLGREGVLGRISVAISSLANLAFFPFGTIAGGVGLYWCFSEKARKITPAADSFSHNPKAGDGTHRWVQIGVSVGSIFLWMAAFQFTWWWGRSHGLPRETAINGLVLLILCDWICTFFHETGHAIAGWASEMTLTSFTVGPFSVQKRSGVWKPHFNAMALLTGGGSMSTAPLHLRDLRGRMAFEIAGGPAASLFTAAVAFLVLTGMPGSSWANWWRVPALVAALSASGAVLNLIPFGFAALYSDGALLLQLFSGGRFADFRTAMKMVASTMATDTRPRDLDAQVLAAGLRVAEGTPEPGMMRLIEMVCAVDRGDVVSAREHLEASLEYFPDPAKAKSAASAAETAAYMAVLDGNADRARFWLQGAEQRAAAEKKSLADEFDYWLAVGAVRRAEGFADGGEDAWRRASALAARKPQHGLYHFERDLLQEMRTGNWVREREAAAGPPPLPLFNPCSVEAPAALYRTAAE